MAFPELSIAQQYDGDTHDIPVRLFDPSILVEVQLPAVLQLVPDVHSRAFPLASTAMQKVAVGHDMESRIVVESILVAEENVDPL